MKILMFANTYLDLYQQVVDELQSQGHEMTVIKDYFEYFDPKDILRQSKLNDSKIGIWNQSVSFYWKKHEDIIANKYDMFISFNGYSINHTSFELISKYSPNCIKVLYCWDSFNYFDLKMIEGYFDKLYTFDVVDAQNSGWTLLPSFYKENGGRDINENEDYDLFLVGSDHDRRYSFVRKVLHNLKSYNLNHYIKIYVPPINNIGMNLLIDCFKFLKGNKSIHELLFKYGLENKELKITNCIDSDAFSRIMSKSKCILDDNRIGQAGLSPRFICSMAQNKKVITTNKWAYRYSFVNKDNVRIVDKDNPIIDVDFIKGKVHLSKTPIIESLELSNWVKLLIGEKMCPSFINHNG